MYDEIDIVKSKSTGRLKLKSSYLKLIPHWSFGVFAASVSFFVMFGFFEMWLGMRELFLGWRLEVCIISALVVTSLIYMPPRKMRVYDLADTDRFRLDISKTLESFGWVVYRNNNKFLVAQLKHDRLSVSYYIAIFSKNQVYVLCSLPIPFVFPLGTLLEECLYQTTRKKAAKSTVIS